MVNKGKLFEDRGLENQPITQTRGRNSSTILKKDEQLNKNIPCEAIQCNFIATERISLSAGKFGNLEIYVCDKCVKIFKGGK